LISNVNELEKVADPLTRLAPLATLSPKGEREGIQVDAPLTPLGEREGIQVDAPLTPLGERAGIQVDTPLAPLGERVPEVRGQVRGCAGP